jgi:hypothetical protein
LLAEGAVEINGYEYIRITGKAVSVVTFYCPASEAGHEGAVCGKYEEIGCGCRHAYRNALKE